MNAEALAGLKIGGWLGMIGAVAALAVLLVFARRPEAAPRVTARVVFFSSRPLARENGVLFLKPLRGGSGCSLTAARFWPRSGCRSRSGSPIALGFWFGARALGGELFLTRIRFP